MGCDIHPHIEVKVNGKWLHYSAWSIERYYRVFEKICGERGKLQNAISTPRGLPDDLSEITKLCYEYDNLDAHTETWLTWQEFKELLTWCDTNGNLEQRWDGEWTHKNIPYLGGNHYHKLIPGMTDLRFICWFDN